MVPGCGKFSGRCCCMKRRWYVCHGLSRYFNEEGTVETRDFDELVDRIQSCANVDSARVVKDGSGAPPMFAAHMELDGKEYVCTLTPTDLLPAEDRS